MTKRPQCSDSENIVRAIRSADYDRGRISSGLFLSKNEISVSRLQILQLGELFPIFHKQLDRKDSSNMVIGAGEINVGALKLIGRNHTTPTILTVEEDPLPDNPAHAVIPQTSLPRGVCRKIADSLIFRRDPEAQ